MGINMRKCSICEEKHYAKGFCIKHYNLNPERKIKYNARMKIYNSRLEVKEKRKIYNERNKKDLIVRERKRKKCQFKYLIITYHELMNKKNLSKLEILRLEAIADVLGRDLEEWRTQRERDVYHDNIDKNREVVE